MTTKIAGKDFKLSRGQPLMHQRRIEAFVRNGGRTTVVQQTGVVGDQFVVNATTFLDDSEGVVSLYNDLRNQVGNKMAAEFDTGLNVESLMIMQIGQPDVQRVGGCSNYVVTFPLVCLCDEPEDPTTPGALTAAGAS